jgi:hypothetical protein
MCKKQYNFHEINRNISIKRTLILCTSRGGKTDMYRVAAKCSLIGYFHWLTMYLEGLPLIVTPYPTDQPLVYRNTAYP